MPDLVCISHLRWDFVWQRPQHLLSRLGQHDRVLYVEEPAGSETAAEPYLEIIPQALDGARVTVVRMVHPVSQQRWIGHGDPHLQPTYTRLLLAYLQAEGYRDPVLWLYTPMALDFVPAVDHALLVYDVMDQLAAFKGAPVQIAQQEARLLPRADLVFTGGVSLYRAKRPYNSDTHLFPSGVEQEFFGQAACRDAFERPAELRDVSGPVLGYFGVIDERMDLPLLAYLADARPDWQIVMVGPVAKISSQDLPRRPNIYYCGRKAYAELPGYLAHFDVALIPFALNNATRYVSPTKTLEYMAAHKPIVSTPIHDVSELYGEVVRIGSTPEAFLAQVEAALIDRAGQDARRASEDRLLAKYAWDHIAGQMRNLIHTKLEFLRRDTVTRTQARAAAKPLDRSPKQSREWTA